jgi:PIN domain nuclease of toxin-antitoxin system
LTLFFVVDGGCCWLLSLSLSSMQIAEMVLGLLDKIIANQKLELKVLIHLSFVLTFRDDVFPIPLRR